MVIIIFKMCDFDGLFFKGRGQLISNIYIKKNKKIK